MTIERSKAASKRRRSAVVLALGAVVAAFVVIYLLRLHYADSLYFSEGSVPYYAVLPADLRSVPRPSVVGTPRFYYSVGDGPKPGESRITFLSRQSQAQLQLQLAEHFTERGYQESRQDDEDFVLDEVWIVIDIQQQDDNIFEVDVARFH